MKAKLAEEIGCKELAKKLQKYNISTSYEKRDHWGFFKKIELLAWHGLIALYAESNGASFIQTSIICTRVDFLKNKFWYVPEQIIVPVTTVPTI